MAGSIYSWSLVAANNDISDPDINWLEGQLPDTVNNSARTMMTRVTEFIKDVGGTITTTGSGTALAITMNSAFTTLTTGRLVVFKANVSNTGPMTLNVNALGSKSIRKFTLTGEANLEAGDIQLNGIYAVIYDTAANGGAGAWVIQSHSASRSQADTDARYFRKDTSDTTVGNITISKPSPTFFLQKAADTENTYFVWKRADGKTVWHLGHMSDDNWNLRRYDAAGAYVNTPFYVVNSTGIVNAPTLASSAFTTATVAATGAITTDTTVTATGNVTAAAYFATNTGYYIGTQTSVVLGTATGGTGNVYLRPTAYNSTTGQASLTPAGLFSVPAVTATGAIIGSTLKLTSTSDASATSTGHAFQVGEYAAANVIIDNNEIFARNNGVVQNLGVNGTISLAATGMITCVGIDTGALAITSAGAVSGATTISASGQISSGGLDTGACAISSAGAISGATSIACTSISCTGAISGSTVTATSDETLKTNIREIDPAAAHQVMLALKGYHFNWVDDEDSEQSGLIAQKVQAVAPELVVTVESKLSLNYNGVLAYLASAYHHQEERLARLEALLIP